MNKYGLIAQEHWQRHAPSRYAALENPSEFFEELGQAALDQIEQLQTSLEAQIPKDLPYLEQVGQLRAAQKQAEEQVLNELVYSVEPEASSLAEELEQMLGDLPSPQMIEDSLTRMQQDAQDEAEREGWTAPTLTDEQQERADRLTALLPLVSLPADPSQMSEAELTDRILALRPFWDPETRSLTSA